MAELAPAVTPAAPTAPERLLFGLRCGCLLLALASCVPALLRLEYLWRGSDYLGHAYLIPVVSLGLAYARRRELIEALHAGGGNAFGILGVLAAASFEAVAVLVQSSFAVGIGIPLVLMSACYAVGGRRLLAVCLPSLLFLLLMVPPPRPVQNELLIGLKSFVVSASVALLQQLGYVIAATGNRIFVPQGELFVADACSGMTSLVTLAPLAAVTAYFLSSGIWRRAVVLVSALPIAILGNVVRVVLTVALVSRFGIEFADKALHESFGVATFGLGTVALVAIAKWVR